MNGNTYLVGADAVERAGNSIQRAAESLDSTAEKFRRVASDIDFALSNHQRFMNDWLERLQTVLEQCMPDMGGPIYVRVVNGDAEEPPAADMTPLSTISAPSEPDYVQEGPID